MRPPTTHALPSVHRIRFVALALLAFTLAFAAAPNALAAGEGGGKGGATIDLSKAAPCAAGQQPTPASPCKPGGATKENLDLFPDCKGTADPTPTKPCDAT